MDRFESKVLLALAKLVADGVITYEGDDSITIYAVVRTRNGDCGSEVNILGNYLSFDKAKRLFNEVKQRELISAEEADYVIACDDETSFEAGQEGFFNQDSVSISIVATELFD